MSLYVGTKKVKVINKLPFEVGTCFVGNVKVYDNRLPAGQVILEKDVAGTYTFTLEHKQNYAVAIVGAGGGQCGDTIYKNLGLRKGGTISVNTTVVSSSVNSDGTSVSGTAAGGASLYNGYGKGGDGVYKEPGNPGVVGYFKITTA